MLSRERSKIFMSKYGYYLGMTPEQQDIVKMIREFAVIFHILICLQPNMMKRANFRCSYTKNGVKWACLVWTCRSSTAGWDSTP